jgi:hypothetical protein
MELKQFILTYREVEEILLKGIKCLLEKDNKIKENLSCICCDMYKLYW